MLRDRGNLREIINNVPDENYKWVKETIFKLKHNYFKRKVELLSEICNTLNDGYKDDANLFKELGNRKMSIFNDEQKFDRLIWNDVKPIKNIL